VGVGAELFDQQARQLVAEGRRGDRVLAQGGQVDLRQLRERMPAAAQEAPRSVATGPMARSSAVSRARRSTAMMSTDSLRSDCTSSSTEPRAILSCIRG
jgi:hypothetical protein